MFPFVHCFCSLNFSEMSAADEDTELRDLVAQTLHQQGILSKIKAQLRASIFLALDEHDHGKLNVSLSVSFIE